MLPRFLFKSAAKIAAISLLALTARPAFSSAVSVGTGPDTVEVLFNWPDNYVADYDLHYGKSASDLIDVYDATQAVTADPNLTLQWNYDATYGYYLNVASYTGGHTGDGDTYNGSTAPNNYWAEWINTGSGWTYGNGASFDSLGKGDQVGWVFGSTNTPVPEPASLAVLVLAALGLLTFRRRGVVALGLIAGTGAMLMTGAANAADSATVVPGTLVQGTVKASLGSGTTYDAETNNLGDWPLTTGGTSSATYAISFANADYNGPTPNTIIAFGNGGGVTLKFATPITPHAGEKDLGIFTAQMIVGGLGSFLNGYMEAAILVSSDDVNWYTLNGAPVSSPTTYVATAYPLNAPEMAYNYGTDAAALNDGLGVSAASLSSLSIANYTTPMPDDSLFNNAASTNAQRLALAADSSASDYAEAFGNSGGGNWFDISGSGLGQVDYVRLNGDANVPTTGGVRLDAVFASASAVPEPASVGALLCGGVISLVRRRASNRANSCFGDV